MFGQSLLSAFGSAACTTDTDQLFTTDVQTTSVATYQLNNATTSIPSNTYPGTPSNITYAAGVFGNAAVFNGSSGYIDLGVNNFKLNTLAISLWVNVDSFVNNQVIYDGYTEIPNQAAGILIRINSSGNVLFDGWAPPSTYGGKVTSTSALSTNTWYHLVFSITQSEVKIYIDGSLDKTGSISGFAYHTNHQFALSALYSYGGSPSSFFNGSLDQVRIFNTALPQAAVTALYNETTTTATYPYITSEVANPNSVAYYKMSDATDQFGNYNGTASNVNFNTEGKFGFAGAFNGSSSLITLPSSFSSTYEGSTTWSFSAWVNLGSSVTSKMIFSKYNSSVQVGGISIATNGAGKVNFFVANSSDQRQVNNGNTVLSTNTWHNIVVIWSSGTVSMYVDGNAETITNTFNTYTGSTIPTTTTSAAKANRFAVISYSDGNTYYSELKIDQVRIYDSALSAANVTTLYNEIECPAVAVTNAFNTVLYTGNSTNDQSITGVGFKPDFVWIKSRNTGTGTNYHGLWDSVRGTGGQLYSELTNPETNTPNRLYSFDSDGFSLGNGVDPEYIGNNNYASWNWKAPLANLSTSFNGSSSVIDISASAGFPSSVYTVSMWLKINDVTAYQGFFVNVSSPNIVNQFAAVLNSGRIDLWAVHTSGNTTIDAIETTPQTPFVNNTWYNVVIIADRSLANKARVFVNNTENTYNYRPNVAGTTGYSTARIGIGDNNYFGGLIDQVRIFNSTLSASEISDLYAEPLESNNTLNYPAGAGCIAAYPLQTDAVDLSGNYNGTPSNVTFGQPGYLTSNTNGTIPSTVATNVDAGFSIVSYTGNGTNGATVGHGLSQAPELIITKGLSTAYNWSVVTSLLQNGYLELNTTSSFNPNSSRYITAGTTTNSLTNYVQFNQNNINHIAYCFHSVPGYSKISSFIGGTSGSFVYTGFQPRLILIKRTDSGGSWNIFDDKINSGNAWDNYLRPNTSGIEASGTTIFTVTSTGFNINYAFANGSTYIFLAIA